jgi:hypothetical protein
MGCPKSIRSRGPVECTGPRFPVKKANAVRSYYVLPCCLLLLNLCNNLFSYKTEVIHDPFLRVAVVILLVLFGGSVVAFAIAPGLEALVRTLHRGSRNEAGILGEIAFLTVLGVLVFWLYYRFYILGPESLLPRDWWNTHVK